MSDTGTPESHGVYGGTQREDGKMQEEPTGTEEGGSVSESGTPESHGVYGGTQREDGKMQEEPSGTEGSDEEEWAEQTQTGGDAT